ncbi:hypothetical protein BaRGS_00037441 [Batillaria attramentaria]|uniref:NERD domain-containing protein n=1 Tax=Batillaria attramentaria TaxID=370345 RepID=A0ABD0J9N5_9CAEN
MTPVLRWLKDREGRASSCWKAQLDLPFLVSGQLNIVLFVGTEACYIVEAKNERTWDTLIQNQEQLHSFTDSVYRQIHSNIGLHDMTNSDAIHKYHSNLERTQCQGRTVYRLVYTEPVVGKK